MGNFIDRNPEDMKAYAKIVKDYAANMVQLIRATQGALSFYESELDDKSRKCIKKFNDDCTNFLRLVDSYHELSSQIEKKAKMQEEARSMFRF